MLFPVFFAAAKIVVLSINQWILIIVGAALMFFTTQICIKLMQNGRVSTVSGIVSGLVIAGTSNYINSMDFLGLLLIIGGVFMLIKQ